MTLFTAHFALGLEVVPIDYESIDECLSDKALSAILDGTEASIVLWAGNLRLTGKPLRTSKELRAALVDNSKTILRRVL